MPTLVGLIAVDPKGDRWKSEPPVI